MSHAHADIAARHARLHLAVEAGLILPDAGQIAVLRPRAGEWFDPLPRDRLHIVQGFRPDHDAFAAAGFDVAPELAGSFAGVMVCLPRAKAEARALIAAAVACSDGWVIVDGQKADGIEGVLREVRERAPVDGAIAKAHGKLFWFNAAAADFSDWQAKPLRLDDAEIPGFVTLPGLFSADGVDPASRLLVQALPDAMPAVVADLGAGWGYLAAQVLRRAGVQTLHLVEAEAAALDCARHNIHDARAQFHWADATTLTLTPPVDMVVMNPPFHTGHKGQPSLGVQFIATAKRILKPQGTLWMVANRHLPYEAALTAAFRDVDEIGGTAGFKLYRASHPLRDTSKQRAQPRKGQR